MYPRNPVLVLLITLPSSPPPSSDCITDGLTAVTGPCESGYFCSGGSYFANPVGYPFGDACPAGYVCPSGTATPIPCPLGTIQPSLQKQSLLSDCLPCPIGRFCNSSALTALSGSGPCSAGFWCAQGQISPTPTNGTYGGPCEPGYACPAESRAPVVCDQGLYQPAAQQAACLTCPGGTLCINGTAGAGEWAWDAREHALP